MKLFVSALEPLENFQGRGFTWSRGQAPGWPIIPPASCPFFACMKAGCP